MRSSDELCVWKNLSFDEKKSRWMQVGERRSLFPGPSLIRDQLKRLIPLTSPVQRLVSLVPSLTQTLYDLELATSLVGATVFCPALPSQLAHEQKLIPIGGTKKLNLARIRALQPELIIANKEENIQQDIETLAAEFPVWVSDVVSVDEGINVIWLLGEYLNRQAQALRLVDGIMKELPPPIFSHENSLRFAYLVWSKPWMVAARGTFIDNWLGRFGLHNCFSQYDRYPSIALEQLIAAKPDVVLLPDEPYSFSEKERSSLQALLPLSKVLLVSGRHCSWYGSPMGDGAPYLRDLVSTKVQP